MSLVDEAQEHIRSGRPAEAIPLLQAHLLEHPQDPRALIGIAQAYATAGDWAAAEPFARQLTELEPHDARHWCVLGAVLRKLARFGEARMALGTALELEPRNQRAYDELAKVKRDERGLPAESGVGAPSQVNDRAPTEGDWYVRLRDRSMVGPLTLAELEDLVARRIARPRDHARRGQGPIQAIEDALGPVRTRALLAPPEPPAEPTETERTPAGPTNEYPPALPPPPAGVPGSPRRVPIVALALLACVVAVAGVGTAVARVRARAEYVRVASDALDALSRVDDALDVGVNITKFSELVADATHPVNTMERTYEGTRFADCASYRALRRARDEYSDSARHWSRKIDADLLGTKLAEAEEMQKCWARASGYLEGARDALKHGD